MNDDFSRMAWFLKLSRRDFCVNLIQLIINKNSNLMIFDEIHYMNNKKIVKKAAIKVISSAFVTKVFTF